MATAYHANYFAHDLTRCGSAADVQRLSMSFFDACIDLNPHQIEVGHVLYQAWPERLIEEDFHRLMFDVEDV